ncbi:hypothetical protein O6H91_23G003500 [Diphasiastrum complanatum]|uniref:Uncharacterized protein n=1 Tax=Diphasiastrum complanatum TaxID=34168 RepID=A0ACC2A7L2_DIPCM|nr:hypothetical protein O6H91_23G003500 [Diphasiastrum complanatum]
MEKISVAVRVRPPIKQEVQKANQWTVGEKSIALYSAINPAVPVHSYVFDHVFGSQVKNADLYKIHIKEVIMSAVRGFNSTVFAYGQTSSGKTYTMQGSALDPGIIHLAIQDVFSTIYSTASREFLIRVSYLEIYNEEINDLLAPENRKLRMHENLERGIYVAGLREEIVSSPEQVLEFLAFGESHRHFGETNMNLYSSRSHTIFRMVIESRDKVNNSDASSDAVRVSTLNMVDLAGSERISKTGSGGVRLKEGTHINKSLMTLGTVINKLSEGAGRHGGHIPFRDSKLTRILQPALGGNAKTAIICTITPDEIHLDESRGTLQFANRANKVTTCAQVNEILTDAALLKRQKTEIEELRQKLQGSQSGDLEQEVLKLRNDLLKFELDKERLALELEEEKKAQVERERRIKEQEQRIENLSTMVVSSAWDDRERAKPAKKNNRRETWCPHQLSSGFASETNDIQRHVEKDLDPMLDKSLVSVRGERPLAPLPEFEELFDEEGDTFWSTSSKLEDQIGKADDNFVLSSFGNIADEDMWLSLNKRHFNIEFSNCESHRTPSSAGSTETSKIALLEFQLNELQVQHEASQASYKLKEIEAARNKEHFNSVLEENLMLKNQLENQLVFEQKMEKALAGLGKEVSSVKVLTDSLQQLLIDCQNFQGLIISELKEFLSDEQLRRKLDKADNRLFFLQNRVEMEKEHLMLESEIETQALQEQKQSIPENLTNRILMAKTALGTADNDVHSHRHERYLPCDLKMETNSNTLISQESAFCDQMTSQTLLADLEQTEKVILEKEEENNKEAGSQTLKPQINQCCKGCLCFIRQEDHIGYSQKAFVNRDRKSLAAVSVKIIPHTEKFTQLSIHELQSMDGTQICATSQVNLITDEVIEDELESHEVQSPVTFGSVYDTNVLRLENLSSAGVDFPEKKELHEEISNQCNGVLRTPKNGSKQHNEKNSVSKSKAARVQILARQFLQEFCALLEQDVASLQDQSKFYKENVRRLVKALQVLVVHCYKLTISVHNGSIQCDRDEEKASFLANRGNIELPSMHGSVFSGMKSSCELDQVGHQESYEWDMSSSEITSDCSSSYMCNEKSPRSKEKLLSCTFCEYNAMKRCGCFNQVTRCKDEIDLQEFITPVSMLLERVPTTGGSEDPVASGFEVGITEEGELKQGYLKAKKWFDFNVDNHGSSANDFDRPRMKSPRCLLERLQMSQEHIFTLEQQLAISNLEKERMRVILFEQTNKDEENVLATRIEKLRLAHEMSKCIGTIAVQDEIVSTLCFDIKDFEKMRMPKAGAMKKVTF